MTFTGKQIKRLFREEWDRLDKKYCSGQLTAKNSGYPGCRLTKGCRVIGSTYYRYGKVRTFTISRLHKDLEWLMDTIRHEIAHAAAFLFEGRKVGHGPKWQKWAEKFGAEPRPYNDTRLDISNKKTHVIACAENCGYTHTYYRAGKTVKLLRKGFNLYKCPKCRSDIELISS